MSFFSDLSYKWRSSAPYQRNRLIAGVVVGAFLLLIIVGFAARFLGGEEAAPEAVTIEFWDVFDSEDTYRELFQKYTEENPNVEIKYRKISFADYRDTVTNALAAGEGPDIYAIQNSRLPLEIRRLTPMNDALNINPALVLGRFPDVVRFDFSREDTDGEPLIYALPLSIDTLALYYNENFFNSEGFAQAPASLEELVEYSQRLRRIDELGSIQLAGIAMGAAGNVNRATDILTLLMLQSGAQMNDPFSERVTFDQPQQKNDDTFFPGREALRFYTSFAVPVSENYTWSPASEDSIESFVNERAAMMINYSYQRSVLRDRNPNLDFAVGPMPQPSERLDRVNYANYWGLAVTRSSSNAQVAWDLINFLTQEENAKIYLEKADRPPALRSLVDDMENDPEFGVFARQILSARSWIQPDASQVENVLKYVIHAVLSGERSVSQALDNAALELNNLVD